MCRKDARELQDRQAWLRASNPEEPAWDEKASLSSLTCLIKLDHSATLVWNVSVHGDQQKHMNGLVDSC